MKKALVVVVALALVAMMVCGCGAPAESSGAPAESSAAPAESSAAPAESSAAPAESSAAPAESSAASGDVTSEWAGLPAEAGMPDTGLDKEAVKSKGYKIGFAQCVMDHPYRINMVNLAQQWCDEWGVEMVMLDGEGDTSKEVSNVESLISMGVDAICISSHGGVALTPALAQAAEQNIPIILIDGGKPFDDWTYATWMSTDDWQMGQMGSELMVKDLGGKGKVVELQGTAGSSCTIGRNGGFMKGIEGSDIEVVFTQDCNWLRANAIDVVTNVLQSNPDLAAVYAHNDEMALGAIEALEAAGKKPGQDVMVYSVGDYQTNAFEAIEAGKLRCTILYSSEGQYAVEAAVAVLEGKEIPQKINLGTAMCTIDNVKTETPAY